MRYTTYTKFVAGLAEQVNLQALLDQLGDFLLESGFAGTPWWGDPNDSEGERSLDDLRNAILNALIESGQLTPDMLKLLKDGSTGDADKDKTVKEELAALLDRIVQRLTEEGYLNLTNEAGQTIPPDQLPGGEARAAARTVKFDLKEKGADFLGYRTLRALLGALGRSAIGAHETPHLATSVESESASKVNAARVCGTGIGTGIGTSTGTGIGALTGAGFVIGARWHDASSSGIASNRR